MTDSLPPPDARDDAAWARVFSELSHDVRSIVGGAMISLDAFALVQEEADRARVAGHLKSSLRRMVRLAEDLHDIADQLEGKSELPRVEHDLVAATRRACERLRDEAALRQVELAVDSAGLTTHVVRGDPLAWDRTLERLVEAGLSGAPRRGRFEVTLAAGPPRVELPWPLLDLPAAAGLADAWTSRRLEGEGYFARSLWLARAFLVAAGGDLAVRDDGGARRLVATLPGA